VEIQEISRDELKAKLDRQDDFKLIMALGEWAFRAKRIPGSIHYPSIEEALRTLDPGDEIIVYCSNASCVASVAAYRTLVDNGYTNVRRYAGGLLDWEDAGYSLEGEWIA
jgi:rhodanese-related sulfurtransferase